MQTKYIGYARVSTVKQAKGSSIDQQKDAITKYCKAHDYTLDKIYIDSGVSAFKDRPNRDKALQRLLKDDSIHGIICYDLTRFGRSTSDLLLHINDIQKHDKHFVTVHDVFDINTKTGKLLLTVLSAIADFEAETIRERMESGREYAKLKGTKSGKPMHRPLAKIDWDKVDEFRKLGLSWTKTAVQVGVSTPTLINRAKSEGHY